MTLRFRGENMVPPRITIRLRVRLQHLLEGKGLDRVDHLPAPQLLRDQLARFVFVLELGHRPRAMPAPDPAAPNGLLDGVRSAGMRFELLRRPETLLLGVRHLDHVQSHDSPPFLSVASSCELTTRS